MLEIVRDENISERLGSFESFITDIEKLRQNSTGTRKLAENVADRLNLLITDPNWLPSLYRQPDDNQYKQHLLYVALDRGFSVVSLVWKPGQKTPIHDHVSWCVVGVYVGLEEETGYRLYNDPPEDKQFLIESSRRQYSPGQTVWLVPPGEDIHQVTNVGDTVAISIHVYGADIEKLGSSINRRFDDLPIEKVAGRAKEINWR